MTQSRYRVQQRPEESRYVLIDNQAEDRSIEVVGEESYVDVLPDGQPERVLFHTFIADEYNGLGLASQLVQIVVDDVIAAGFLIVPVCPYVDVWLKKHPEYADHVVQPTEAHHRAAQAAGHRAR